MDDAKKAIIGQWVWEKTIEGHRDQEQIVKTPESEGKTIIYTFNKEGKMIIFEDGTIRQESDYEIVLLETSVAEGVSRFRLNVLEPVGLRFFIVAKDTLMLFDGLGTSSSFIKK